MNFGEYLRQHRDKNGISLRGLAAKLSISAPYLTDIEKGRRYAPDKDKLDFIASLLNLSTDETELLYDLAAQSRNDIPADIKDFILCHPEYIKEIRSLIKNYKEKSDK